MRWIENQKKILKLEEIQSRIDKIQVIVDTKFNSKISFSDLTDEELFEMDVLGDAIRRFNLIKDHYKNK